MSRVAGALSAVALLMLVSSAGGDTASAGSLVGSADSARELVARADADLAGGRPGSAIVQLERARLLAPRAPAIAAGLAQARAAAGLPASPKPNRIAQAADRLSPDEWARVALVGSGLIAGGLVAVAWRLVRIRGLAIFVGTGTLVAAVGLLAVSAIAPSLGSAVVTSPTTIARKAPFAGADPAFVLPEGVNVTVERRHGDYDFVATPEGRGWVPSSGVETILQPSGRRPS